MSPQLQDLLKRAQRGSQPAAAPSQSVQAPASRKQISVPFVDAIMEDGRDIALASLAFTVIRGYYARQGHIEIYTFWIPAALVFLTVFGRNRYKPARVASFCWAGWWVSPLVWRLITSLTYGP